MIDLGKNQLKNFVYYEKRKFTFESLQILLNHNMWYEFEIFSRL